MRSMRCATLVAALAAAFSAAPASAQFSNVILFGDSLTDAGSFRPVLPPGTGKFTTNPGPVYAEILGQRYGFSITPANQGGTDYAEGGARVTLLPGVPDSPPTGTATPITTQIQRFLAKGPADPNALYTVWGGANDLFVQLAAAGGGTITPAEAQANVATAATDLVRQVATLHAGGAKYIIVINLPDIGKTPSGAASGQVGTVSALSGFYNSTLDAGLNQLHIDVIKVNLFGLFNEVIASPSTFGFTNVTTPACTVASLLCTSSTLVAPNAPQTFLFADGVHPTTAGHALIADYLASILRAPQQASLLVQAPLQVEQSNFRAIDARMTSAINAPRAPSKFEAYAVYDYGNNDRNGDFGGGDNQSNSIVVGGDMKLSEHLLAGIAFGYTEDKASLGSNAGGFKLNEATGTAYVGYGQGPWYVGATLGGGDLDYRNIRRSFGLAASNRTESGDTRGTHVMARAMGGYWFSYRDWLHGPFARLTYQEARVYEWSETGTSSTAMTFGHQKLESLSSSLGWQASGWFGRVRPFGRVTWEKEYKNDDRTVSAGLVSLPGTFTLPVLKPDDSYALFAIGLSTELAPRLAAFLNVNATAGKSDGNYQAVTVGLRMPL